MTEHGRQHGHPVADTAAGAGQVHDQGTARHPGHATGQNGGRHSGRGPGGAQRLGDPRDLPLHHPLGHLRGEVARGEPGPAGGDDDVVARGQRVAQRRLDRLAIRDDQRAVDRAARRAQRLGEHGAGLVRVHARRRPVRHRDRERPDHGSVLSGRRHGPVFPPSFHSTRTSVITAAGSMAFTMSISARAATDTEVSASISTPVRSAVRVMAVMSTPSSVTARSTVTPCSPIGWHSGMRSGVRLAPAIPAMRATASASPFGTSPARSAATASADSSTRPDAQADRAVTSLPDTSTIRAWPALSTCVRPETAVSLMLVTILLSRTRPGLPYRYGASGSASRPRLRLAHGRTRTSAVSPSAICTTHSGTTTSALALPSVATWCEP